MKRVRTLHGVDRSRLSSPDPGGAYVRVAACLGGVVTGVMTETILSIPENIQIRTTA